MNDKIEHLEQEIQELKKMIRELKDKPMGGMGGGMGML